MVRGIALPSQDFVWVFPMPSLNKEPTCGHPEQPPCPRLIPLEDHLCLLLGGPPLDDACVDDLLNHLNTKHWRWFISF